MKNGHARSVKASKNIFASFVIKGMSILLGFLLVPLTLEYLDTTRYGIWLTLSSFLTWFAFFEIGLGNGLRNKLAEALARKNYELGKIYVSTTYAILAIISGAVCILFFVVNPFINWSVILNTEEELAHDLTLLAYIVFGFFFLTFVIKLVGTVLVADQRPAINNAFGPLGNLIALIVIYVLTKTTEGSLVYLGLTLSISPVLILVGATIYFYNHDYKKVAPSIHHINFKYARNLLGLGIKFFLIQISGVIILHTGNVIITQFFGPAEVTPYNIALKYYSIINMAFFIIMQPFWSAFTDAWTTKDYTWIKKTVNTLVKIWFGFLILGILLYIVSDPFFDFWIGKEKMDKMVISNPLQLLFLIYFLALSLGGIFNMFINGVGRVYLQMWARIVGAALFIPLNIILIKVFDFGIEAVIISIIISNFYVPLIAPIHYYKIIKGNARGIWIR
jgi:O-antigen/teichoic acid export membrane protein